MKRIPFYCFVLAVFWSFSLRANTEVESVGLRVVENLLDRGEYMRYGEDGLHYAEACAAMGAMRLAGLAGDEELMERLVDRYRVLLDEGTDLVSSTPHVDFSVIGIIPLQVYLESGDAAQLERGLYFADRQWEEPREDGLTRETRWWIDDMYMVGALQMQAYRATGKAEYADRAARFLAAYLERLQQENGLFFHGPDAPFFWGRGNGWVASGLAETLSSMPEDHPLFESLLGHYGRMMEALLPLQSEAGYWRQLIDYPDSWEESSCTAMFAYAMEVGAQKEWLEADRYRPVVDRAWAALVARLDGEGNLDAICVGTGQSLDAQYYLDRPKHSGDFHGQAPLLWLAVELLRREE
ncbi:Glycosyl Hydrolase Family 88 superfamily [Verrucomicrobiia bacterium DG1235]|nr:Glycosyl Hydrolase Family 88 superfamily [Verrucomicrobiae bacterium DG1235]